MKYAAVTTFPNAAWEVHAKEMLASFRQNWDCPILIALDDDSLTKDTAAVLAHPEDTLAIGITDEQSIFLKRNFEKDDPKDYRKQYTRFSHKVFAMDKALDLYGDKIEYLVWIDADVITHKKVTEEDLKAWLPGDRIASYLGRKDWSSSETGFIIFNMKNGGREFIKAWKEMYLNDEILTFPEWTDAYAFDMLAARFNKTNNKDIFWNLSQGLEGRDVFEASPLGTHMTHFKGPRKSEINPIYSQQAKEKKQHSNALHGGTYDINNLNILTQNCVKDDTIKENVTANLQIIDTWLEYNAILDEEIVICSAGPSLCVEDILPWYEKGVKIVAVKHALKRLLSAGIKPWACILLDPREHVSNFVRYPVREINWFVASMVDPQVTNHLVEYGCKVFGYHAMVGAEEMKRIPKNHILVQGGSATATRGISLLKQLGFRKMHLYGYDCCYFHKPDLHEKKGNGKLRYEEVTLAANTWGGQHEYRTWWTEGQFLAQVQEMSKIYFQDAELQLHTYGDGIIPWMNKAKQREQAWREYMINKHHQYLIDKPTINDWLTSHGTDKSSLTA
jgi:hypothetical protein